MVPIDWGSIMFPELNETIEAKKTRKGRVGKKTRLRERTLEFARIYLYKGVSENEPEEGPFTMPSWGLFEDDPQVRALLTEDDCKIPFTEDRYEQVGDLIAKRVITYNIRARQDLARMHGLVLQHGENEEEADENIIQPFLARATTVFHFDLEAVPNCLSYQAFSEISYLGLVRSDPTTGHPQKWTTTLPMLTPDVLAGKIARELLRVAGAPENSTWEEMESICDETLVCTCCKPDFEQPNSVANLVGLIPRAFLVPMVEIYN